MKVPIYDKDFRASVKHPEFGLDLFFPEIYPAPRTKDRKKATANGRFENLLRVLAAFTAPQLVLADVETFHHFRGLAATRQTPGTGASLSGFAEIRFGESL